MAELPERLREAAVAHRPDRERMLARVEHAMAAPETSAGAREHERQSAPWMRLTAVTAAVAGAIGLGGLAVGAVAGEAEPTLPAAVASVPGSRTSSASATTAAGGVTAPPAGTPRPAGPQPGAAPSSPGRRATAAPRGPGRPTTAPRPGGATVTGTPTAPASARPGADGAAPSGTPSPAANYLAGTVSLDAGSSTHWAQSDLALTSHRPVTSLTVELRVARTDGVVPTGSWSSIPGMTSASVTVQGDELVYRWTLDAGRTLEPGTHTFAGQFDRATGDRPPGADRFTAAADGPGGPATAGGVF